MLTLPEMEKVCDRLDSRLASGGLDGDSLADVATALMLIVGRLQRVVDECRSRLGPRRDLLMARAALESARASLIALAQPVSEAKPSDWSRGVTSAQHNVALTLTLLRQANIPGAGVA